MKKNNGKKNEVIHKVQGLTLRDWKQMQKAWKQLRNNILHHILFKTMPSTERNKNSEDIDNLKIQTSRKRLVSEHLIPALLDRIEYSLYIYSIYKPKTNVLSLTGSRRIE